MTVQFPPIDFSQRRASDYICKQETMGRLASEYNLRVPHYQRNYSWDNGSVEDMMNSIFHVIDTNATGGMHMLSHMTFHKRSGPNGQPIFDILDGQQRITTFFLLLATLLRELQKTPEAATRKGGIFESELCKALFLNWEPDAPGNDIHMRLQHALPAEADIYKAVCVPAVKLADLDGRSTMVRACETITTALRAHCGRKIGHPLAGRSVMPFDYLKMVYGVAMSGLEVMITETDRDTQVNRLFEDMNSKGQPLAQCDLVRNHFAQHMDELAFTQAWAAFENARLDAHEKCDPFLTLWLLARYGEHTPKNRIHKIFCTLVAQERIVPNVTTLAQMTTDMRRIAAYKAGTNIHGTPVDGLVWLNEVNARQHIPTLIAAEAIEMNDPDLFADLCNQIARTVLTTTIADGGNAKYQHSWQRWAKLVATVRSRDDLNAFLDDAEGMRKKRADLQEDLVMALAKSGEGTAWANGRPKRNHQQFLALAYAGLAVERATGNARPARCFLNQTTLEHIVPAKAAYALEGPIDKASFEATVTALGNMTLLVGAENSGASNKPLAHKRTCYAASGVAMARALIQPLVSTTSRAKEADLLRSLRVLPESFGPAEVALRSQEMAKVITSVLI